jgi:hypothetical protein
MHEPTKASERREAARRGGASTSSRRRLLLGRVSFDSVASIRSFREALTAAVLTGQVQAARAGVAAGIAKDAEAAFVAQALEARMDALEERLGALLGRRSEADGRVTA